MLQKTGARALFSFGERGRVFFESPDSSESASTYEENAAGEKLLKK